jgi:ADP-heptose:LPS heptosyltransferase
VPAAEAGSITLVKRDNIGDFVLATAFCNVAYQRWKDRAVTLVCAPGLKSFAEALYPRWTIQAPASQSRDFRGSRWFPRALHREIRRWPVSDLVVSLRAARLPDEVIFDSWIPGHTKLAIRNQSAANPYYLPLDEKEVYDVQLSGGVLPNSPEVSRDLLNYRALLSYCFPGDAVLPQVFPRIEFARDQLQEKEVRRRIGLPDDRPFLALCPFPSSRIRRYPNEKLVVAVRAFARRHPLTVVIMGGPADVEEEIPLRSALADTVPVVSAVGKLSLLETATLLRESRVVLSVETGLAHLAAAFSRPTVVLIGGGHYGWFGPWGDPRRVRWLHHPLPCYQCNWLCELDRPRCVEDIPANEVDAALESVASAI